MPEAASIRTAKAIVCFAMLSLVAASLLGGELVSVSLLAWESRYYYFPADVASFAPALNSDSVKFTCPTDSGMTTRPLGTSSL